jgi:hypothetical protein
MSGQQIGTVIGGVAGFAIGGPAGAQIGMAIGGLVGGIIDPTKINGPKIGDGQTQQSTDGIAIPWVQGTARIAGTIVQYSPRRQVRVKDSSGKGGPSVHHYEAHQDFAILVCESCSLRDSSMGQILIVEQDGHIVYDVRPGSTILSDSAKWKANVDFMFGDEGQLPHPTLEAITGVGNQVSYRGSLVVVFRDFNLTTMSSNRIPSFVFTVQDSGSAGVVVPYDDPSWKYLFDPGSSTDYSSPTFDDRSWAVGRGGFGNGGPAAGSQVVHTPGPNPDEGQLIWLRRSVNATPGQMLTLSASHDNNAQVWWNGALILDQADGSAVFGTDVVTIPGTNVESINLVAMRVRETDASAPGNYSYASLVVSQGAVAPGSVALEQICTRICLRGGLQTSDFDVSALNSIAVLGYPIARQSSGTDALTPLLAAFFAYASEFDAKLNFKMYGADAVLTIDEDDLLAGNDANDGYITKNLRNQQTEFPKRIVASYYDPAQNYFTCQVPAGRTAIGIKAIGDQAFDIPVVMDATTAKQAADKALKVAYATLEGTIEDSVPFAMSSATYLSLASGDAVIFRGKRYVLDEVVISQNYMKLTKRYERQSAYTSLVQAIAGNPPEPPTSPYSGPSTLLVLNLPSLRPQDTYGVYLAAASLLSAPSSSWAGCAVQMSLDGQVTWNTVASISQKSTMGTLAVDEPGTHEPITVQVNDNLETVAPEQIAAQANGFAITAASGVSELGQFQTATEQPTVAQYQLTNVTRGLKGTVEVLHLAGESFTMLDAVYFVPIDTSFAGKTLYFRTIGFGESVPDDPVVSCVYTPDLTIIINGGKTGT